MKVTEENVRRCGMLRDRAVRSHIASILWFVASNRDDQHIVNDLDALRLTHKHGMFADSNKLRDGLIYCGFNRKIVRKMVARQKSLYSSDARNIQVIYKKRHTEKMKKLKKMEMEGNDRG